ncbi:DUF2085 domain-containing protein [Methanocalculus sp. MC3]
MFSIKIKGKTINLCFCHRKKERSIPFFGLEKYLCSRCLGMYLGFVSGLFFVIVGFRLPFWILIPFFIPMVIDGTTQLMGLRKSNNCLRLITGLLFGFSISFLVVIW